MKLNFGKTVLRINISFALAVTLTLIIDESGLCAAGLFCCMIHEAGHIICLLVMGEKPKIIELSFYGIRLERYGEAYGSLLKEIIIYASGPAVNFVLSMIIMPAAYAESLKSIGLISFFVGVFNLIPCKCLDGGNIMNCVLKRFFDDEKSEKINFYVSCVVLAPMLAAGTVILLKTGNITLFAVTLYLAAICYFDKMKNKQ